eukprot:5086331-Prymnesium_polylepis.1
MTRPRCGIAPRVRAEHPPSPGRHPPPAFVRVLAVVVLVLVERAARLKVLDLEPDVPRDDVAVGVLLAAVRRAGHRPVNQPMPGQLYTSSEPFSSSTSRSAGSSALTKKPAASFSMSVCLSVPELPAAARLELPAAAPELRAFEPARGAPSSSRWPPPPGQFSQLRLRRWQPGPHCSPFALHGQPRAHLAEHGSGSGRPRPRRARSCRRRPSCRRRRRPCTRRCSPCSPRAAPAALCAAACASACMRPSAGKSSAWIASARPPPTTAPARTSNRRSNVPNASSFASGSCVALDLEGQPDLVEDNAVDVGEREVGGDRVVGGEQRRLCLLYTSDAADICSV